MVASNVAKKFLHTKVEHLDQILAISTTTFSFAGVKLHSTKLHIKAHWCTRAIAWYKHSYYSRLSDVQSHSLLDVTLPNNIFDETVQQASTSDMNETLSPLGLGEAGITQLVNPNKSNIISAWSRLRFAFGGESCNALQYSRTKLLADYEETEHNGIAGRQSR